MHIKILDILRNFLIKSKLKIYLKSHLYILNLNEKFNLDFKSGLYKIE